MDNTTGIQPALTPAQWQEFGDTDGWTDEGARLAYYRSQRFNDHGTAAACLYGQTFGFVRDDVEMLLLEASTAEASDARGISAIYFRDLAARIAALLPPE